MGTQQTKPFVIFDLDDTLFNELDYLKSAFLEIAEYISRAPYNSIEIFDKMMGLYQNKSNVFEGILKVYNSKITIPELLELYRNHSPKITMLKGRKEILDGLKSSGIKMGLLTDGRSIQQRSKIEALGIQHYFHSIVISEDFGSEKPNENNFVHFQKLFGPGNYFYVGDNISKDFISPNKMGWTSICIIDNGNNIHKQDFDSVKGNLPKISIKNFESLAEIFNININ